MDLRHLENKLYETKTTNSIRKAKKFFFSTTFNEKTLKRDLESESEVICQVRDRRLIKTSRRECIPPRHMRDGWRLKGKSFP